MAPKYDFIHLIFTVLCLTNAIVVTANKKSHKLKHIVPSYEHFITEEKGPDINELYVIKPGDQLKKEPVSLKAITNGRIVVPNSKLSSTNDHLIMEHDRANTKQPLVEHPLEGAALKDDKKISRGAKLKQNILSFSGDVVDKVSTGNEPLGSLALANVETPQHLLQQHVSYHQQTTNFHQEKPY